MLHGISGNHNTVLGKANFMLECTAEFFCDAEQVSLSRFSLILCSLILHPSHSPQVASISSLLGHQKEKQQEQRILDPAIRCCAIAIHGNRRRNSRESYVHLL